MAYHSHSRSYSGAYRRYSSGMPRGSHGQHPSIPENEVVDTTTSPMPGSPPPVVSDAPKNDMPDFDNSVDLLVASWIGNNPSPTPAASTPSPVPASTPEATPKAEQPALQPVANIVSNVKKNESPITPQTSSPAEHQRLIPRNNNNNGSGKENQFKTSVRWGNRKIPITLPAEFARPNLVTPEDHRKYERKLHDYVAQNINIVSPSMPAFQSALYNGRAVVQLPDEKDYREQYAYAQEQRLGVSSPGLGTEQHLMQQGMNMYSPGMHGQTAPYYQYSQAMGRSNSSPLSPEAPAFMSTNGLGITYGNGHPAVPQRAVHIMSSPAPVSDSSMGQYAYSEANKSPYAQQPESFGEYRAEVVEIVRPPRESKRIPIVNPQSKQAAGTTAADNSKLETERKESEKSESEPSANRYSFTPLVQSGAAAKDLNQDELDGIVNRLSEHTPERVIYPPVAMNMGQEDDTESMWSDGTAQDEQRQRLVDDNPTLSLDDQAMQKLVNEALMKKLDPLEKMMSMLTDQLKNTLVSQVTAGTDDEFEIEYEDDDPEGAEGQQLEVARSRSASSGKPLDGSVPGRTSSRNVSNTSENGYIQSLVSQIETLSARNEKLDGELDMVRRAKENADALVTELTQKYIESEKYKAKAESYVEEIGRLKEHGSEKQKQHEKELREQHAQMLRERELHEKERSMQQDQIKILQDNVTVLNDKLRIAAQEAEREAEKARAEVIQAKRETEDAVNSRATELSWIKTLLDAKVEELDEQRRLIRNKDSETVEKTKIEEMYANMNSSFLSKLKYGSALSLVSDEFVELLTAASLTLSSRGVVELRELRRRQSSRQTSENAMPLNDHPHNVPAGMSPLRPGFSNFTKGLKDLKLNRANTIHGMGSREDHLRKFQLSREV
ncbi:hypothetical protein BZA70DRAFT_272024 [Myxozyma melibiosi]|uniref:Uncharacterized protein n=1 Tax=Myxozyma melibiosi TaxID=54550 RepID=A0ABR1FCX9_9ASCO